MGNFQQVGKFVELLLRNLLLVDDNGIFHVTAFDEVGIEQWLNVSHEDKSAGRCHFLFKVGHVFEGGKLAVDEFRLERAHGRDAEFIIG